MEKWAQAHFFVGRRTARAVMSTLFNSEIADRVAAIADGVGAAHGIEIVEIELLGGGKQRVLRIYIDRPEGVTHADCELVSQAVGELLDAGDVIPGDSYTLEVSSPGVERKLTKPEHFERFLGQKAKIVLREPVEKRKRWEGRLAGFSKGVVTLEPSPGKPVQFALEQIEQANLKFEW